MNLSVASTTNGSALGSGKPVVDGELAILSISAADSCASDATVCVVPGVGGVGEAAADAPREERSGVRGVLSCDTGLGRLFCGVTGSGIGLAAGSSTPSSLSRTALASTSLARNTSTLKRHMARSRFGRLINNSVRSTAREGSKRVTAAKMRSRSEVVVGATEPEGDEVRGGVERDAATEMGVEGCSGAEAVAFRAFGSSNRESCELTGEGVFVGGVTAEEAKALRAR